MEEVKKAKKEVACSITQCCILNNLVYLSVCPTFCEHADAHDLGLTTMIYLCSEYEGVNNEITRGGKVKELINHRMKECRETCCGRFWIDKVCSITEERLDVGWRFY